MQAQLDTVSGRPGVRRADPGPGRVQGGQRPARARLGRPAAGRGRGQHPCVACPPTARRSGSVGTSSWCWCPATRSAATRRRRGLLAGVRRAADSLPGAGLAAVSASVGAGARCRRPRRVGDPRPDGVLARPGSRCTPPRSPAGTGWRATTGPIAARHRRSLDVERRLRIALEHGDLDVHYQPILSLDTGRVVSIEALARWTDPVLGRVGPDEFVAVAERSALIGAARHVRARPRRSGTCGRWTTGTRTCASR